MLLVDLPRDVVLRPGWWAVSPGVPKRERPTTQERAQVPEGVEAQEVRRLLQWHDAGAGYDAWLRVGMAVHHESRGADWGLELWDEWSSGEAGAAKYPGREALEAKWATFGRDASGSMVTMNWLRGEAERASGGAALDDGAFEVVEVPRADPDEPPPPPAFVRDRQGRIEATVTNAVLALRRPDLCGEQVAWDEFRDEITVAKPGTVRAWVPMTDADVVRMRMRLEAIGFKAAPKELVRDALVLVAAEAKFDSARLWLEDVAEKWDGVARVERFMVEYLGVEDDAAGYARAVGRYLWTALAGRVLQPGVKADMVVILEGPQGIRKSSAIEALAPGEEFFVEVDLGEDEADTVRKLRGALVGEIAELSGLHTRALEDIKKFVVRRVEKWVPKYKEFPSVFARRLVFLGTTNRTDILADETGNRRWLPVHVERTDVEGIVRDREQLWAEGAALFRSGGVAWEAAERLAGVGGADGKGGVHDAYMMEDAWSGAVARWLGERAGDAFDVVGVGVQGGASPVTGDGSGGWDGSHFTTSDCLAGALRLSMKEMDRLAQKRVSAILRRFGYKQQTVRVDGHPIWGWRKEKAAV